MRATRARFFVLFGSALGVLGLLAACTGGDDTLPANPATTSGPDATSSSDGSAPAVDGAIPLGAPLCATYGGAAIAQKVASDLLTAVSADCRIGASFAAPKEGLPHLQQCLTLQLAAYFQCPGAVYDATTKDSAGQLCRSMTDAHKGLNLRSADFNAFIEDLIATMKADGISKDDISAVIPTFIGLKASIVPNPNKLGDVSCTCPNDLAPDGGYCGADAGTLDAGNAGDAGDASTGTDGAKDGGGAIADAMDEG